ncbi:hypothetical protein JCM16816_22210 [Thermoanaerobacter brockii subsp. lactiethylicus]
MNLQPADYKLDKISFLVINMLINDSINPYFRGLSPFCIYLHNAKFKHVFIAYVSKMFASDVLINKS